jgi:hypothetical protein
MWSGGGETGGTPGPVETSGDTTLIVAEAGGRGGFGSLPAQMGGGFLWQTAETARHERCIRDRRARGVGEC